MGSLWDIGAKEIRDSFSSKKFLAVLGLFIAISMFSVFMDAQMYQSQVSNVSSLEAGAVPEKPSLVHVFHNLFSFNLPLTAALLGLMLSYDYISSERNEGTIELLLSYPIYRDEIVNGKLVAGIFTVAFSLLIALSMSTGLAVFMLKQIPSLQALTRLSFVWLGTVIYITFFLSLGTFLSTVFSSRWRSLGAGAFILLFFIGLPPLSELAASQVYPMPEPEVTETHSMHPGRPSVYVEDGRVTEEKSSLEEKREKVERKRENFIEAVSRLSPFTTYRNYGTEMLLMKHTGEGLKPSFTESLRSSLGYLIYLISQTSLTLAATYTVFLRQDL
ncbi:MAG: ABC transporter permease [Candidatus Nanohalobium sp.]